MRQGEERISKQDISNSQTEKNVRLLNPTDINVPSGYSIEVFANGLDTPISLVFTEKGDMLIGDAGVISGNPKVLKLTEFGFEIVADGFTPPLTGINYLNGDIYVSHRGKITVIKPDGSKTDILTGLPSFGDHTNNKVVFGPDNKIYFGQGTATNSGVVGLDNTWVAEHPYFHDFVGSSVLINGYNFVTENVLTEAREYAYTGPFSPFGIPSIMPYELLTGNVKASGSILRANLDGSDLELVAWGFRNPFRIKFDRSNQLFVANHGADVRGSRPLANCTDELYLLIPDVWYGWPDYIGGKPVTLPEFRPEEGPEPQFLLTNHPCIPPKPYAVFAPHSAIMGFDFNYNRDFGTYGDVYIAEFGSEAPETTGGVPLPRVGHRISKIDMTTGTVSTFARNKTGVAASEGGGGGFERPIDVVFGPDEAMYVLDFTAAVPGEPDEYVPGTGVIWRILKNK